MFAHGGAGTASMCHMHNSYTHALASSASLIGSEFPRTGLRPFVVNRNIRNYLWYGGVARGGLRAKVLGRLGRRLQALSKSVCSILPVARWLSGRGSHQLRPFALPRSSAARLARAELCR